MFVFCFPSYIMTWQHYQWKSEVCLNKYIVVSQAIELLRLNGEIRIYNNRFRLLWNELTMGRKVIRILLVRICSVYNMNSNSKMFYNQVGAHAQSTQNYCLLINLNWRIWSLVMFEIQLVGEPIYRHQNCPSQAGRLKSNYM